MEWFGYNEIIISLDKVVTSFLLILNLFVIVVVFKRRRDSFYSSVLLKLLLFILLFIHFVWTIRNFGYRDIYLPLLFLYYPSFFLVAPISYLYITNITTDNFSVIKRQYQHILFNFFQFIVYIFLGVIILFYHYTGNIEGYNKFTSVFFPVNRFFFEYFFILYLTFYAIISIRQYIVYRKKALLYFSFTKGISMTWLKIFIASYILYLLILILVNNDNTKIQSVSHVAYDTIEFINIVVFLTLLGVFGSKQVNTYSKYNQGQIENKNVIDNESANTSAMSIPPKLQDEIISNLEKLISEEKIFMKTSLTLFDLANELNTNRSYLSKVINDNYKINFHTFINNYRVEEVKQCLVDQEFDKFNLDGIAEKCGFVSSSALCKVFKKVTGTTPTEYKNKYRN